MDPEKQQCFSSKKQKNKKTKIKLRIKIRNTEVHLNTWFQYNTKVSS